MTSSCASSSSSNFFPARCLFRCRNKWKSPSARSGLDGGWPNTSYLNFSRSAVMTCAEWGRALSWSRHKPRVSIPLLLFRMAFRRRAEVSQYAVALTVAPRGMKSTKRMPFMSQKTDAMNFFTAIEVLNFLIFWGNVYGAIAVTVAWIQECGEKPKFHLPSQWSPESLVT